MNRDKDIVEKLGGCWHEFNIGVAGYHYCIHCKVMSIYDFIANPDFTSDAGKIQLLRKLMESKDWHHFIGLISNDWNGPNGIIIDNFLSRYIADPIRLHPGKLRDAVWEWLYRKWLYRKGK